MAETTGGPRSLMSFLSGPLQRKLQALPQSSSRALAPAGEAGSTGAGGDHPRVFQVLGGGSDFCSSLLHCHARIGSVLARDSCHIILTPRGNVATKSIPASCAGPGEVHTGPTMRHTWTKAPSRTWSPQAPSLVAHVGFGPQD